MCFLRVHGEFGVKSRKDQREFHAEGTADAHPSMKPIGLFHNLE